MTIAEGFELAESAGLLIQLKEDSLMLRGGMERVGRQKGDTGLPVSSLQIINASAVVGSLKGKGGKG